MEEKNIENENKEISISQNEKIETFEDLSKNTENSSILEEKGDKKVSKKLKTKKRKPKKEKPLKEKTKEKSNDVPLNRLLKPVLYATSAIILELINFLTLFIINQNKSEYDVPQILPTYFVMDLSIILCLAVLLYIIKNKTATNVIFYILISLQIILNITNSIMYISFGIVFSFELFSLANEGLSAFNFDFMNWSSIVLNLAMLALIIVLQIIIDKKASKKIIHLKKISSLALSLILFFSCYITGISAYTIQVYTLNPDDSKYIYADLNFKAYSLKRFGTFGYYAKNLYNFVLKDNLIHIDKGTLKKEINRELTQNTSAPLKNDNLVVIMLESFEWFAIDEKNTPTLWNLKNNSLVFDNYYSNNKTNISEDICFLGYMPNDTQFNIKSKDAIATQYSLPNLFKNAGYSSSYFHSYESTFFDRKVVNKRIGFDNNLTFLDDVNIENKHTKFGNWNRESDYINAVMNDIAPANSQNPFFSFYLTVSSHGPYDNENPNFAEYYQRYDENLEATKSWFESSGYEFPTDKTDLKHLKNYKAAAMDTDKMVENLLTHLKTNTDANGTKLIDNTTLILYADHNAYYHDLTYKIKGTNKNNHIEKTSYRVPLMIYSENENFKNEYREEYENNVVNNFVNTYDLYPTICELFGLKYSKYFTLGHDMLDSINRNRIYFSALTGFYGKEYFSPNLVDIFKYPEISNPVQKPLEFKHNLINFYLKFQKLDKLYRSDLKK